MKLWSLDHEAALIPKVTIKEDHSESIIWNLHVAFPIALVCRDTNVLDVYHLVSVLLKNFVRGARELTGGKVASLGRVWNCFFLHKNRPFDT